MCDSYTLLHDPSKNGAAKSQIPIRGTYRTMKFQRLLLEGSWEHKSVKLSSNVASRRFKCVTVIHFYTIRPKTEPPNPRYRSELPIEQ